MAEYLCQNTKNFYFTNLRPFFILPVSNTEGK